MNKFKFIAEEPLTLLIVEQPPLELQWPLEEQSQRVQSICPNCIHHRRNALGRIWCEQQSSSDLSSYCALHQTTA